MKPSVQVTTARLSNKRLLYTAVIAGLVFAFARAVGMSGPAAYRFVLPLSFVLMMLLPFVFLTKAGRRKMGFVQSNSNRYFFYAVAAGALLAFSCYVLGLVLYGTSANNWFISIRNSYYNTFDITGKPIFQLFLIFTIPALIFSPWGEEIFFRGFLHEALNTTLNYNKAAVLDAVFFALIHLFHHGIVKNSKGVIQFFPVSGLLWVLLMFVTAMVFAWLKKQSGSIYPAVVAHLVFNLVMNVTIFYWL